MTPLRERVAAVLEAADLLGAPSAKESTAGAPQPSWGRLAEILKCLQAYDRLPAAISQVLFCVSCGFRELFLWFS